MEEKLLNIDDVVNLLRQEVKACGSQEAFATRAGVTQQYVGDVLRGQRFPGQKILEALGIEKIAAYRTVRAIRIHKETERIELQRAGFPWDSLSPEPWSLDFKTREFIFKNADKEYRYPSSEMQNDPDYWYGKIPVSVPGGMILLPDDGRFE